MTNSLQTVKRLTAKMQEQQINWEANVSLITWSVSLNHEAQTKNIVLVNSLGKYLDNTSDLSITNDSNQ